MITQSTKLNLIPGDVPKRITASQYDAGSRTLSFTLYNGAVAFTTAGVTAQIRGTKPDQKGFEYTATYNAGVVTCDVTEQMTACAGEVICELQLSKDGEVLGTANFILDVERAALGEDTDISETELPDIIDGARTQAANAAESAEDAAESAAIAEQAASGVYLGINMGKVVTVTSGVADTDIDLERMPKPGERILLVFEEERTSVTNIKTYLDGAGITIPIGTGEPSQKYLGQYVFECASGTQPESRLWNMVTKDYGVLPTPFAIGVGGTGNTSGYIRTGREGSSTVGTAATIEGTHNEAGYANQTVMGVYNNNKADTLLEVGNGSSSARSNALEVFSDGHVKDGYGNDMESLSALEATASGNPIIVNAQDVAAKGLKVRIEPIQDLHGQANPYPAGGGKNKLPMTVASIKALNTTGTWSGNAYTLNGVTFTLNTDSDGNITSISTSGTASADIQFNLRYFIYNGSVVDDSIFGKTVILNGCPSGGSLSSYFISFFRYNATSNGDDLGSGTAALTCANGGQSYSGVYIRVLSGTNVSGKVFYPMLRLSTESDATFAPWENKCPISGRTEVNLGRTGKNLCNQSTFIQGLLSSADGSVSTATNWITSDYIPVKGSVALSGYVGSTESNFCVRFCQYNENKGFITNVSNTNISGGNWTQVYPLNVNTRYVRVSVGFDNKTTTVEDYFSKCRLQIEHGEAVTAYEAPQIIDITIALGQTVYGGNLDVKTGAGNITYAIDTYDGSNDEDWVIWQSGGRSFRAYTSSNHVQPPNNQTIVTTSKCNELALDTPSNTYMATADYTISTDMHVSRISVVIDSTINTVALLRAWLAQNPLQFCYELAAPIPIQLTGEELALLKGYNYISGDGIIDLVYVPESISGLMEEVLVPISLLGTNESGNTKASRAYVTKEYFYKDKKMYRVTANIAQGAAFTVNTNCVETTLFAELKAAQN